MKSARNYKTAYQKCAKESAGKDRLIALLHGQLMQLADENRSIKTTNADQAGQIKQYQDLDVIQQTTILAQAEKLTRQQAIIAVKIP